LNLPNNMSEKLPLLQEIRKNEDSKETRSFKEIIMRYVRYWPWFVLGLLVAFLLAFLYLCHTTPIYKVTSSVIMKDARSSMGSGANRLDFALLGASGNVANELYVLQSHSLIKKVINRLNLHTTYIVKEGMTETELYKESPVIVTMEQSDLDALRQPVTLYLEVNSEKGMKVSGLIDYLTVDTIFQSLPALLHTPAGNISFTERKGTTSPGKPFRVEIRNPNATTRRYRANLDIFPPSQRALVLNLSLKTPSPAQGRDFLNTLVETYNNETIEDNKMEAMNTQAFINERILIINEELIEVEQDVEKYKRSRGLTNFQTDLKRDMEVGGRYEQQLVEVETQLNIVNSLNEYVNNPDNANKTIPYNVGIAGPLLAATITEYNRLLLERERLSQSMTGDNPAMMRLDEQVTGLRHNINTSINSVQRGLSIQRRDARTQVDLYGGRIRSIPTKEREFIEISREQQIKARLFLTLLQKREENALALAATANNATVLDEAMVEGKVAPRSIIVLPAACLLGLLVPVGIIYLIEILQYRIHSRADVDHISKVPVLAEIPRNKGKEIIAVKEQEISEIDEAFRMLRTSLMLAVGTDNKVVIFTSTVSGEGKTFIALNTAISMALLDKKVLLAGMDVRNPRLTEYMNLKTKEGLTLYLSGFEKEIDNLIVPSEIHPNLDVLPAGPIPPNPAELLTRPTLDRAFALLREEYDYIFIDSAPSAQVTDTHLINRVSDVTVYVCRIDYSKKENLRFANDLMQTKKFRNMLMVVNETSEYQGKFGYGYGYGNKKEKKG